MIVVVYDRVQLKSVNCGIINHLCYVSAERDSLRTYWPRDPSEVTLRLTSLARYVSGARAPDMGNRRRKMNIDQRMRELYSTDNVFSTGFSADSRFHLIIPGS